MKDFSWLTFPYFAFGDYSFNPEYNNLNEEEKFYLDYMDSCLQSENERINNACFEAMLLVMKLSDDPDAEPEDVHSRIEAIKSTLDEKDRGIIDDFLIACINSMGVFSEERVQERRLKRERKN